MKIKCKIEIECSQIKTTTYNKNIVYAVRRDHTLFEMFSFSAKLVV